MCALPAYLGRGGGERGTLGEGGAKVPSSESEAVSSRSERSRVCCCCTKKVKKYQTYFLKFFTC